MDLKEGTAEQAAGHWYYQHKWRVIANTLRRANAKPTVVTDVGSGSGYFAEKFSSQWPGARTTAVDSWYDDTKIGIHGDVLYVRDLGDAPAADFYSLMDVLEHVEDDSSLMRDCVLASLPGAYFLVTVPAFSSLWSPHDVFLGHFRRYELEEMERLVTEAGLTVLESRYLFGPLFIPALIIRRIKRLARKAPASDMKKASNILNWFMLVLLGAELKDRENRKNGLSILVLAKKDS